MSSEPRRRRAAWALMTLGATLVGSYGVVLVASNFALLPDEIADNDFSVALRAHIAAASLALLLGPWQFVHELRRKAPVVHRLAGRAYVAAAVVGGTTGTLVAPFTHSGAVAGLGFLILGLLWVATTARALQTARRRDIDAHRRWAIRSFSLAFAAVTLRLYLPAASGFGLAFDEAYPTIAWLCWLPNLVVAERMLRREGVKRRPDGSTVETC